MTTHPTVFSIPVQRAFADALAAGLIDRFADGALGLAEGLILLPSNRARSAVQAAFVRAGGQGLLMPRLAVIGDADLDESVALALDAIDDDPIPPAIDALRRRLMLAALIERARSGGKHVMVAAIESANAASIHVHKQLGFVTSGRLPQVGVKFGRWLDLTFMQLMIYPGALPPQEHGQ